MMDTLLERDAVATLANELKSAFKGNILAGQSLAAFSRWRVGGVADWIFRPACHQDIVNFVRTMSEYELPYLVIGATSNLLFSDEGVKVPILQIGNDYAKVEFDGAELRCESGAWVPGLARKTADKGLTGLEHIVGIPGTVGGLVYMNGGSQRKGIGSHVISVEAVTVEGESRCYRAEECKFAYRRSVFQDRPDIISSVRLRLNHGDKTLIKREMLGILRSRSQKFPRKLPNCGSVFVSDPAMYEEYGPPGKVIELCGLKGTQFGGAQISLQHANFIVNNGHAKASDILYLINLVHDRVLQETGYDMRAEAIYISQQGKMISAHLQARGDQAHSDLT